MASGAVALTVARNNDLRSPLFGVSNLAWACFIEALTIDDDRGPNKGKPRHFNARSYAGGLGCFAISPRRLVELGVLKEAFVSKGKAIANPNDKRVVGFLLNPLTQRDALIESMRRYVATISKLTLPANMSLSGALALHHRLGPAALVKWQIHKEPSTIALFRRANGLF